MLGPHVPVYIGWAPDTTCPDPEGRAARCQTGVIVDGPYLPVELLLGPTALNALTMWHVHLDGGVGVYVAERLLHPIDDADEAEGVECSEGVTA